jgi:M3 family oligoendopeptidase
VHPADVEIWPGTSPAQLIVPVEEIPAVAGTMFDEMGGPFGESFRVLADYGLMDLAARPGKAPGGNCAALADQRVAFIYANQTGTPADVTVLVHEAGHALQKWRSRDIDLMMLRQPTLEAGEVHSMTLELLAHPWAEHFFGDTADAYRTQHLRSQFLAVPYMAAVDDFQHRLYDPSRETLTDATERGTIWGNLVDEYLPGIDWASTPWYRRTFWLRQHHITTKPFYYLDYALAQVVSWQLWLDSLEDRDSAHERYLNLCSLGGSVPFRTLLREANLGDPFDPAVVADVARRLQPHLGCH